MPNSYTIGQQIRFSAAFKNLAGTLTDPTTVTFKIESPSGTVVTYVYLTDSQLIKDSTGNYHVDYLPASSGAWNYRWEGAGAIVSASEQWFDVKITLI